MRTKAKSVHTFEVRLWSKDYYNKELTGANIYSGTVVDCRTRKQEHFHSPSQFLTIMERLYKKHEKELKKLN